MLLGGSCPKAPWLCEAFIPLLCDVEAEGVEPDQRRYAEDLAPTFQSPLAEQRSVVVRSLNDDYFALISISDRNVQVRWILVGWQQL